MHTSTHLNQYAPGCFRFHGHLGETLALCVLLTALGGGCSPDGGATVGETGGTAGTHSGGAGASGGATGGTSAAGGTMSAGGSASTGGTMSLGGTPAAGGTTSMGGTMATGGTSASGGTTGSGTWQSSGGTTSAAGATGKGGSSATGGTPAAGGTSSTGGATATAGSMGTGGASATGGIRATGGTTGTGGTLGTGGATATGGTTGAGGGTSTCGVLPVNPNATQATKNVLCYLYSIKGQKTLSGVQDCSWSPVSDVTYVHNVTGVYPAVVGGDILYNDCVPSGTASWNAGGLSMIRHHMGRPEDSDSYASSMLTTDLADTLTPGTARYNGLMTKFNTAATKLLQLQSAGAVVLWAPFHEIQSNGWFWWSKGTAEQFKKLWNLMFTNFASKGVNNVIWMLPYSGSPSSALYPGKAVVDISGSDTYGDSQPFSSNYTSSVSAVGSSSMPLALHETGYVPNPTSMFNNNAAPWVLFSVWCSGDWVQSTSKNSVSELKTAYTSSLTVNRGGMPKF